MNIRISSVVILSALLTATSWVSAASVTVTGNGSNIIINKVTGFDGADGAGREAAFVAAAQVWADILVSPVDIVVDASFSSSLYCHSSSATLGSAGPLSTYLPSGAESLGLQNNVWYPTALINSKNGSDYFVDSADITAEFNADIGDADCLSSSGWYYGMDGNTPFGHIDFYEVVLHELGHGLGFLSLVNSDGSNNSGIIDIYTTFLRDENTNKDWSDMNNTERGISVVNDSNVVWSGPAVSALVSDLSSGVNSGKVQMYAPSPYEGGSSISHFDTDLTPNELMEPEYTGGASYDHSVALFSDIGWDIYEPSNNVPSITGQAALSTNEDTSLTLTLADLTVTDSDNSYPADFSLTVSSGSNYSVSGNTITPASNYFGTLTVLVTVNDGEDDSATYNVLVTVNAVNDAPEITAQSVLSLNEDTSLSITTAHITIVDPDDSSFTVVASGGANYSVSGSQITPSANYNGTLTVPVVVNDGEDDSDSFDLTVTVNAVNDKPTITSTPSITINEDSDYSFVLADFGTSDVEGNALSLSILSGSNYSVSGNTLTPSENFNGVLNVSAQVNDGSLSSDSVSFSVTVNSVNDLPNIIGQSLIGIIEGGNHTIQLSDISIVDLDDSSFTLSVGSGANYIVAGAQVTPDAEFSGTLTVPITVNDGEDDSAPFNLSITVSAENDVPIIAALPTVVLDEDGSVTLSVNDFTITDVDSTEHTLTVLSGSNYSVIGNTIHPDTHYSGELLVDVYVSDAFDDSATETLSVTVTAVNDAPDLTGTPTLNATMSEPYSSQFNATDIDSGALSYAVTSDHDWLSISATGELTGEPTGADIGVYSVTVTVSDGELSDQITFDLSVNDLDNADLAVSINSSDHLAILDTTVDLTATVHNHGPAVFASGYVEIELVSDTNVTSMTTGCSIMSADVVRCDFDELEDEMAFTLAINRSTESDGVIRANVINSLTDPVASNNSVLTTVMFVDEVSSPSQTSTVLTGVDNRSAAFGDLDGDGKAELVLVNDTNREHASYQFNLWFDQLSLDDEFPGASNANQLKLADLNNDTYLDIVIANDGTNLIYFNDEGLGFDAAITLGNAQSQDVIIADLNADNFLDLVFANEGPNQVYLNDQAGGFIASTRFGTANSSGVDIIDFNTDGYPDIVIANIDDDDLIYLNNGADQSGGVVDSAAIQIGTELTESFAVVVADLDDDGVNNEILIGRRPTSTAAGLEIFQLNGTVLSSYFTHNAGMVTSADVADFDADADADILVGNDDGVLQILTQASESFSRLHIFEALHANKLLMADMNGDSIADIVISNDASAATQLFVSDNPFASPTNEAEPDLEPEVRIPDSESNDENTTVIVVKTGGSLGGFAITLALLLLSTRRRRNLGGAKL